MHSLDTLISRILGPPSPQRRQNHLPSETVAMHRITKAFNDSGARSPTTLLQTMQVEDLYGFLMMLRPEAQTPTLGQYKSIQRQRFQMIVGPPAPPFPKPCDLLEFLRFFKILGRHARATFHPKPSEVRIYKAFQ